MTALRIAVVIGLGVLVFLLLAQLSDWRDR